MAEEKKTPKKKTREEIEHEVREKVSCEERAFRWVERLAMVNKITKEELSTMMNEIMANHYTDIIEERACSKVCGYPLCETGLGKRSQKKYHISMKHNKVIDLAVRENFCSLFCYRASKHLEAQVPTHPIWLRKNSKPVAITLMEKEKPGCTVNDVGEVAIGVSNIDFSEIENPKEKKKCKKKKRRNSYFEGDDSSSADSSCSASEEDLDTCDVVDKREVLICDEKGSNRRTKLLDQKDISKSEIDVTDIRKCLDKIKITLKEWMSEESYQFLQHLQKDNRDSDDDTDEEGDDCFPLPDDFRTQVSNFLSRQPEWLSEAYLPPENKKNESVSDTAKRKVVLPTIDSRSQTSIRRRIVHEKLASCLREVLPLSGLLDEDLTQISFFKFIDTFNFNSRNIVLNSKQWTATTIVLILVISRISANFIGVKKRLKEIDDFLKVRCLPSIGQMGDLLKEIVQRLAEVGVSKRESGSGTDDNTPSEYYYDHMEEVD